MNNDVLAPVQKQRLEWIDAMRGFTILLVVANHVSGMAFGEINSHSSYMSFFLLLRMPLFFFISGFLSFRSKAIWGTTEFGKMLGKKIRIQIIPTLVFLFAFLLVMYPGRFWEHLVEAYHSPMKGGYWFTIALLYMFIVYYIFEYIVHKFSCEKVASILILWTLAVGVGVTCYLPHYFEWAMGRKQAYTGWLTDTSIIESMKYFQFFIYGNIVHRYWNNFQRFYDFKGFFLILVIIAFASTTEFLKLHLLKGQLACITKIISQYSLLTIVFLTFRYYQESFLKTHVIGKGLQYIGTRTLDIYLIHYFFIPNLPEVGKYFNTHLHNFVIDFTCAMLVAILIVIFCLVVSNILRISPFLKKYLFGR